LFVSFNSDIFVSMTYKEILKSEKYKAFLNDNLTKTQHQSMMLKFMIKTNVDFYINLGHTKQNAFDILSRSGFVIGEKKIFVSKETIHKYYYLSK